MLRPLRHSILFAGALLQLVACDDGTRAETAASTARDSALAHDLQLAGDDSARAAGRDARLPGSVPPMVERSESQPAASSSTPARTVAVSSGALGEAGGATARNVSSASVPSAEGYIGPSCASPALEDQRRCLLGYLERSDAQLDRNYQSLINRLKSEAGTRPGAPEPPAVQRLRTAQRSWLVYRDDECRKRTVEQEGPLWAPVRAKCLAEYSALRSRELEDALAKRKAVTTRSTPVKAKQANRSKSSRSSRRRR